MIGRFAGRCAVVTGAASGFGEGIARRLAAEGAQVVVADLNAEDAQRVAGDLVGSVAVVCDVASKTDIDLLHGAAAAVGHVDILVNNAGVTHLPAPLDEVGGDDFDRIYGVNMKAIYLAARRFVPDMTARGTGVIVNIASTAGVSPRPGLTWYNASKGWVISATRSMAAELAPAGIRVNAVSPVAGETPLLPSFMGGDTDAHRERFIATIPMGRFSTPRDVAAAVAFLASDEADMITGESLLVDGGRCI